MPQLLLNLPHSLGQDEALRRLKQKFAAASAKYGDEVSHIRQEWQDHTFSFGFRTLGMAVTGTVAVEAEKIKLVTQLPLAAGLFKKQIEDRIRQEVGDLLVPQPAS